jgi:hypothetical protein
LYTPIAVTSKLGGANIAQLLIPLEYRIVSCGVSFGVLFSPLAKLPLF